MKALTIHQPYASLIAVGAKTIETRPRGTEYRGPIAIHAAATTSQVYNADAYAMAAPFVQEWQRSLGGAPSGAVVASARLVDVVPTEALGWQSDDGSGEGYSEPRAWWRGQIMDYDDFDTTVVRLSQRPFGDFSPGRFAWLLDDVAPTTQRCPWCWGRGMLACPRCDGRVLEGPCSACDGFGYSRTCPICAGHKSCDPVPARGQQATPWEWNPVAVEAQ